MLGRYMEKMLVHIPVATPVGEFHMLALRGEAGRDTVIASGFGSLSKLRTRLSPEYALFFIQKSDTHHPYARYVAAYCTGDRTALAQIPCIQKGTEFSMRVWDALTQIPYGETISYKALAEKAGNAKAIRAAGTACGANRLILLVPCHRVIKSDGGIGEYLYGKKLKSALLVLEGG